MCVAVNIGKICVCVHIFSQTLKFPVLSYILHGLVGKKNGTTSGEWLTSWWRHLTTGTCYCGVRDAATTLSARESSLRHTCKGFMSLWRARLVDARAETSAMTQWELVIVHLLDVIWPWCRTAPDWLLSQLNCLRPFMSWWDCVCVCACVLF